MNKIIKPVIALVGVILIVFVVRTYMNNNKSEKRELPDDPVIVFGIRENDVLQSKFSYEVDKLRWGYTQNYVPTATEDLNLKARNKSIAPIKTDSNATIEFSFLEDEKPDKVVYMAEMPDGTVLNTEQEVSSNYVELPLTNANKSGIRYIQVDLLWLDGDKLLGAIGYNFNVELK